MSKIKNYTSKVPAAQSIKEIEQSLVSHGAIGVMYEYEQGTERIGALKFLLMIKDQKVGFALPVQWRMFQAVLKKQRVSRAVDDDFAYRVAWRCIRDWVLAQMAMYETQIVELPQIFLPFAMDAGGHTLYESVVSGKFLLGDGNKS